jgi:hypothetical protein
MSKKNRDRQSQPAPVVEQPVSSQPEAVIVEPNMPVVEQALAEAQPQFAPLIRRSIVPEGYREKCVIDKEHKTPAGNTSVHCGDELARFLVGKSLEQVYDIAAKAFGPGNGLKARYSHLNVGQQRMNVGNRLRAAMKDGLINISQLQ